MNAFLLLKVMKWPILFVGILIPAWSISEASLNELSVRAEQLFSEKLYQDAIPFYSKALAFDSIDQTKMQLSMRLAACSLRQGNPQKALYFLTPLLPFKPPSSENPATGQARRPTLLTIQRAVMGRSNQRNAHKLRYNRQYLLYLTSLALRQLGDSTTALSLLNTDPADQNTSNENCMMSLEKGYLFYCLGDLLAARSVFSSVSPDKNHPTAYYLAQIHLAKIDLSENRYKAALRNLKRLSQEIPSNHPLHMERLYLAGCAFSAMNNHFLAEKSFAKLLPKAVYGTEWSIHAVQGYISAVLNQALVLTKDRDEEKINTLLAKAGDALQKLAHLSDDDAAFLLNYDFLLIRAKILNDPQAYEQAQNVLNERGHFTSEWGKRTALLKQAEAAPTYFERKRQLDLLIQAVEHPPSFKAKALFIKGLNDLHEGMTKQRLPFENSDDLFDQSADAFVQSAESARQLDPTLAAIAYKHCALAYALQNENRKINKAWEILNVLISEQTLFQAMESPQEILHLACWTALHVNDPEILARAKEFAEEGRRGPSDEWAEKCHNLLGLLYLQSQDWEQADAIFTSFLDQYPKSILRGEVWFWKGHCADQCSLINQKKECLRKACSEDPASPFAPIAYFHLYSFREYMQSSRKVMRHLQAMPALFPSHPLTITAHYMIGLYYKKNLISEEGETIRQADLTAAIDAFQKAETTFDVLSKDNLAISNDHRYYAHVAARAQLERAQANFAIAKSSSGGKKQIYLEYAEGVFKDLIQKFETEGTHFHDILATTPSSYPKVWAEAELKSARLYKEKAMYQKAEEILNLSLSRYQKAGLAQGHGLTNLWLEKGKLAKQNERYLDALEFFKEAEQSAGEPTCLSPNEKLDLWIQQSICLQALHQYAPAMKLLSRVVNEDAISPLRIKAMYMRAEIYEEEERPELALKQLEAAARKGGEWGRKAQEKLEKNYGY